ncbi:MAG: peptidylprolyl isomerase, partial [Candidatus Binatia bacterium]
VREIRVEAGEARSVEQAERIARDAAARLRSGEPFAVVARELGDPPIAPLPDGLLPAAKLRDYLGPSVTAHALALSPGGVSDPIATDSTWHVVQMVAREAGEPPASSTLEAQARAEMARRRDDEALRAYLDRLREAAAIRVPATR